MPPEWWIPLIIGFIFITVVLASIRRRREAIRHKIRRILIVEFVYIGVAYGISELGRTGLESLLAGVVAALIVDQMIPSRSTFLHPCDEEKSQNTNCEQAKSSMRRSTS